MCHYTGAYMKHFGRLFSTLVLVGMLVSLNQQSIGNTAGINLIANNSYETLVGGAPAKWVPNGSNTIDAYFEVVTNEAKTGTNSAYIEVGSGTGEAKWQPDWISTTGGKQYTYSSWYVGTAARVRVMFKLANGTQMVELGTVAASTGAWKQTTWQITVPFNAVGLAPYIALTQAGWINLDEASLTENTTSSSSSSSSSSISVSSSSSSVSSSSSSSVSSSSSSVSSSSSSSISSSSSSSASSQPPAPTSAAAIGRWKQPIQTSVVGIQAISMPNSKIMLYDGSEGVGAGDEKNLLYETYDTKTSSVQQYTAKDTAGTLIKYALFCGAMVNLANGNTFVAGGDINGDAQGSDKAAVYNPLGNTWTQVRNMFSPRWYPSGIQLQDGRVLVVGGTQYDYDTPATSPEIFNFSTGRWTFLSEADDTFDPAYGGAGYFYPWLYQLRSGKVVNLGPRPTISKIGITGSGSIDKYAYRDLYDNDKIFTSRLQTYGNVARISPDEVLFVGGGVSNDNITDPSLLTPKEIIKDTPQETANIARLDLIDQNPPVEGINDPQYTTQTGKPTQARSNASTVILPNGKVMLTGGSAIAENANRNGQYDAAVRIPEVWDRTTGQWTQLAAHQTRRIYHNTALLQADGTVFTAGGSGFNGQCTANRGNTNVSVKGTNACRQIEVYEPSYLFNNDGSYRARPLINSLSTNTASAGSTLTVNSNASISKVTLVKSGVMTHGTNLEQYYLEPTQSGTGTTKTIILPSDYYSVPRGRYFVFVWDSNGTPSVAQELVVQ
jgi:galactose oxidase